MQKTGARLTSWMVVSIHFIQTQRSSTLRSYRNELTFTKRLNIMTDRLKETIKKAIKETIDYKRVSNDGALTSVQFQELTGTYKSIEFADIDNPTDDEIQQVADIYGEHAEHIDEFVVNKIMMLGCMKMYAGTTFVINEDYLKELCAKKEEEEASKKDDSPYRRAISA